MRKRKTSKRVIYKQKKNKYSNKTRRNNNFCKKGITDEVIRIRKFIHEISN